MAGSTGSRQQTLLRLAFGIVIPVLGIWADLTLFALLGATNVELVGAAWRIPRPTCLYVPIWTGIGAIALWLTVGPRLRGMKRDALAGLLVVAAVFGAAFAVTAFLRMFILSAALPALGASIVAYRLLRDALERSENGNAAGRTLAWALTSMAALSAATWFYVEQPAVLLGRLPNLVEADLRNADLHDVVLESFNGTSLAGAHLDGADLSGAKLLGLDMTGTSLREAKVDKARLEAVDLTDGDLRDAEFEDAYFYETQLVRADLRGTKLAAIVAGRNDIREADLRGADLSNARTFPGKIPNPLDRRLMGIYFWQGAIIDDTTQWPPEIDVAEAVCGHQGGRATFTKLADGSQRIEKCAGSIWEQVAGTTNAGDAGHPPDAGMTDTGASE